MTAFIAVCALVPLVIVAAYYLGKRQQRYETALSQQQAYNRGVTHGIRLRDNMRSKTAFYRNQRN